MDLQEIALMNYLVSSPQAHRYVEIGLFAVQPWLQVSGDPRQASCNVGFAQKEHGRAEVEARSGRSSNDASRRSRSGRISEAVPRPSEGTPAEVRHRLFSAS